MDVCMHESCKYVCYNNNSNNNKQPYSLKNQSNCKDQTSESEASGKTEAVVWRKLHKSANKYILVVS